MSSSSNRRSGSSGRSTDRKRVHVGTGTRSRKATESHHLPVEVKASRGRVSGEGAKHRSKIDSPGRKRQSAAGTGQRRVSQATQAKRDERDQRRREARRVRNRRILLITAGVVAVLVAWVGAYRSQLFEIRSIKVTGTERLAPASVEASAAVADGMTLLRVSADDIEARLLANPWISSVDVRRMPPSTLRIDVVERTPAVLVDAGVSFWSVDGSGRILGQESLESTASTLVVVRDVMSFEATAGVVSTAPGLLNALKVLDGITPEIASMVRGISAPSVEETVLVTAGSVEIMVGEATQLAEKCALISGILAEQGENVVFIDVRSIERPVSRGLDE